MILMWRYLNLIRKMFITSEVNNIVLFKILDFNDLNDTICYQQLLITIDNKQFNQNQ